jgi:hypothetical protein
MADFGKERYTRIEVSRGVSRILEAESTLATRRRRAMEYSRDVIKAIAAGGCTDPKFAARQVFKLWRKLGIL